MPDYLHTMLQGKPVAQTGLLLAALVLIAAVVLFLASRKRLAQWREERQVRQVVRRMGAAVLRNLHLPDGTGGEVTIDYVLLCRDALCVIGVKRFHGLIFGGPNTDQWTQVVRRVSYKFPNPDGYLQRQVSAVQALVPDIPVRGLHLFTRYAQFPKDQPNNVITTSECRRLPKRPRRKDIPASLRQAWDSLAAALPA